MSSKKRKADAPAAEEFAKLRELIARTFDSIAEQSRRNGDLARENEQLRFERARLERWLLNQKHEADKWRAAYAEASLRLDKIDGLKSVETSAQIRRPTISGASQGEQHGT